MGIDPSVAVVKLIKTSRALEQNGDVGGALQHAYAALDQARANGDARVMADSWVRVDRTRAPRG